MPRPAPTRPFGASRGPCDATLPADAGSGRAAEAAPALGVYGLHAPADGPCDDAARGGGGGAATPRPPVGAETPGDDGTPPDDAAPAARPAIAVLKKRREFLAAASALRRNLTGLNLQARLRAPEEPAEAPIRVGYTCSKKVGNAVARNRAKRRLRAAAAEVMPRHGRPGWDYVLIGRHEATAARDFRALVADLRSGLAALHARADEGDRRAAGAPVGRGAGRGRGRDRAGPKGPAEGGAA